MSIRVSPPIAVYSSKDQPSFLRSNSERRAADHSVRIPPESPPRNLDSNFLVARAAAISGSLAFLKKQLSKTPKLAHSSDHSNRTLLIYAAMSGHSDCVEWLAAKDGGSSDVTAKDNDGMTAIHWAVHKGHPRTVKVLLTRQVNADPLIGDMEGATALHTAVKQPATKCLEVIIHHLIKRDQISAVVDVPDIGGRSALHWAAAAGKLVDLLKLTKDKLKVTFEEVDSEGSSPLMCAVRNISLSMATIDLITQRAPRSVRAQDQDGFTPLHMAVMVDNIPAIEHLLDAKLSNPNMADLEGRTPLHWTGILGRPGASSLLIRAKADFHKRDNHGSTAMHYAAENNYVESLKTILRHCTQDSVDTQDPLGVQDPVDSQGRTCFMRAAANGSIDVMIAILNTMKSVDTEQKDNQGSTALHCTARNGQDAAAKFLIDRGWPTDALDNQGHSPLLVAAEHGHATTLQLLLKSGAPVWHKDSNGRTALHWSALGGHAYVCQFLIKQGVSVDAVDVGGRTAVHCASFGGFAGCLSVLLQSGAHPGIPDNEGIIALHLAAAEGHVDICKRLVDSGSLINAIYDDETGRRLTPLDMANENNRQNVIDYLIQNEALTFDQLVNVAATKVQACFRGYAVRKTCRLYRRPRIVITFPTGTNRYARKKSSFQ